MGHHHSQGKHREDLTGEHAVGDAGQLIIAILFLAIWVADSFFLKYTTFLNACIPDAVQLPIGFIVLIIAGYLAYTGLKIVFSEVREQPHVIRKSVFGVLRHPIYMAEILLYLGLLLLSLSLAAVVVWIIAIVFLYYISRYEERMLLERFGEEYQRYMEDVPMFLPKLWGRNR